MAYRFAPQLIPSKTMMHTKKIRDLLVWSRAGVYGL
jgi:hypothetical protein